MIRNVSRCVQCGHYITRYSVSVASKAKVTATCRKNKIALLESKSTLLASALVTTRANKVSAALNGELQESTDCILDGQILKDVRIRHNRDRG